MKKINIAFGIHNHQPVGNFDFVFEKAYENAYLPFLRALESHPRIRISQHYTGILLAWLKNHKPGFIQMLQKLVASGQIEMMTGGFYEPVIAVIPDRDKKGQIKKLSDFIMKETDYRATGMWLAERIWEPHLAGPLHDAGIRYVVLDDSHFKGAGLKDEELLGYYLTEEQGAKISLFPISETLRYTIPFQPPEETIDYLKSVASEDPDRLVVFADDGEKFGIWPGTHEHCYDGGWLEKFFQGLEVNSDWINILHFSEALEQIKPLGRIYLPTGSYREMLEWALPTSAISEYETFEDILKTQELHDRFKGFVRGGFWRNFMVKYPESNNMHKKMLLISDRLSRLEKNLGNNEKFKQAEDHLWAGQCNCPYWHGIFGGLYLNHLRFANYRELLLAENKLDQLERTRDEQKNGWIDYRICDFDADGREEILVSTDKMNLYFSPEAGGSLFELDYKRKAVNLMDTMTRREESYHQKLKELEKHGNSPPEKATKQLTSIHDLVLMKEEGLEKLLFYDAYRRVSLLDHFFTEDSTATDIYRNDYREQGDFVTAPYQYSVDETIEGLIIGLKRRGKVLVGEQEIPIDLVKRVLLSKRRSEIVVEYSITNLGTAVGAFRFGIELNFSLLAGDAPDRYYFFPEHELPDARLRSIGEISAAKEAHLKDEWLGIDIRVEVHQAACFWRFPIETISQSEGGFERVYQSSVILPNWQFELSADGTWRTRLVLGVAEIG